MAPAVVIAPVSTAASVTTPTVNGGEQEQTKASIPTEVCVAEKNNTGGWKTCKASCIKVLKSTIWWTYILLSF